ncbi:Stf0 family sulfotransferase [Shimia abyssi]|uniref:LPS sulfotransferase NodH n=1 Tax=Shimia abyssi TaxID=1662395 RepID=A0A2P8F774_9RHOB|nr:Stf0 family sulfotransferase [Shimia abyssi]PSL17563.1 LPS sulfotransferase NodH [Shimia abyssi]
MPTHFLILGLPRSGSTYLTTLLNSHSEIRCAGELFNPYRIIGVERDVKNDLEEVMERDIAPTRFANAFFRKEAKPNVSAVGFKFMIGHNTSYLQELSKNDNLRLIYIYRENRLAQSASWITALKSKVWAQKHAPLKQNKLDAGPRRISQHWHEAETTDFLFSHWLATLPHQKLKIEYKEMFRPGFREKLCDFLDVPLSKEMRSPLAKQGSNTVIDRFQYRKLVTRYMEQLGHAQWLGPEIDDTKP